MSKTEQKSNAGFVTPPRRGKGGSGGFAHAVSGENGVGAYVDHKESGVCIWQSARFVRLTPNEEAVPKIRKEAVDGVPGAFVLHNFFTPEECDAMISAAENDMEFERAKVSTMGGMRSMADVRNNLRVIWHTGDNHLDVLSQRLLMFLGDNAEGKDPGISATVEGWDPYALNPRLRIFKYESGQRFVPHYDGGFRKGPGDRSLATFIAYLRSPEEGGHTNFYDSRSNKLVANVAPTLGTALIFFHEDHPFSPLHEGEAVKAGFKYCVRSDIMYRARQTGNTSGEDE